MQRLPAFQLQRSPLANTLRLIDSECTEATICRSSGKELPSKETRHGAASSTGQPFLAELHGCHLATMPQLIGSDCTDSQRTGMSHAMLRDRKETCSRAQSAAHLEKSQKPPTLSSPRLLYLVAAISSCPPSSPGARPRGWCRVRPQKAEALQLSQGAGLFLLRSELKLTTHHGEDGGRKPRRRCSQTPNTPLPHTLPEKLACTHSSPFSLQPFGQRARSRRDNGAVVHVLGVSS